tara:strand:- start:382 stop:1410 length:1029 start_codon:yes stop_codon:yes gene_type:complete
MKKVAHIYASKVKFNSGDFMLGISTKKYFEEVVIGETCEFTDFDCRQANLYKPESISAFNKFDYIIVGGGGLILPDSSPNKSSCWQWVIPIESYDKITKPIYVISVGYNLFYGQDMTMPKRENNFSDASRLDIFKPNIRKLINKAEKFTLRHTGDMNSLISVIGVDIKDKLSMEYCPSIWYVEKYWKPQIDSMGNKKYLGVEIKDDREWRRYYKIGKGRFYNELYEFIVEYRNKNGNDSVVYMSHDGSMNFYRFLQSKGMKLKLLNNTSGNEVSIRNNYSLLHTLLCSAGHSQMIGYGCGIDIISLVSHPKLEYFCEDIKNEKLIRVNSDGLVSNLKKYTNI